jgi:hypothetical protein
MGVMVLAAWPLAANVPKAVVHQLRDDPVHDPVVGPAALVAAGDQPQVAQQPQLVAHRGHRDPECVRQISDAELVMRQRVDQPKPQGVGEREEDPHRFLGGVDVRQRLANASNLGDFGERWKVFHSWTDYQLSNPQGKELS